MKTIIILLNYSLLFLLNSVLNAKHIIGLMFLLVMFACNEEKAAWLKIMNSNSIEDFTEFVENYDSNAYTSQAKDKIERLEKTELLKRYYKVETFHKKGNFKIFLTEKLNEKGGISFIESILFDTGEESNYLLSANWETKVINEFGRDTSKVNIGNDVYLITGWKIKPRIDITTKFLNDRIDELVSTFNQNMQLSEIEKTNLNREYTYLTLFDKNEKREIVIPDSIIFVHNQVILKQNDYGIPEYLLPKPASTSNNN